MERVSRIAGGEDGLQM